MPVHHERHRPEQTTLYRLVQQHAETFFVQAEEATGASLPQFIKDESDAFLECRVLAHGLLRLGFQGLPALPHGISGLRNFADQADSPGWPSAQRRCKKACAGKLRANPPANPLLTKVRP